MPSLEEGVTRLMLLGLRRLPLGARVAVKEQLHVTGRLDYAPRDLQLDLDTEVERFRLGSCRKEPETVAWLEDSVRPGDVIYDVGANVGAYSLVAAHLAGAKGIVYAFEPGFATFAKLVKNVFLNDLQLSVTPLNVALADETGISHLTYSSFRPGAALHTFGGAVATRMTQPVLAYRLDELLEGFGLRPPDLIKLDVDGAELGVLRGMDTILAKGRPRSILVEVEEGTPTTEEIVAMLSGHHLQLTAKHKHERSGVSNFIFTRP
jgi:FkbM family methyltransferase